MKEKARTLTKIETSAIVYNTLSLIYHLFSFPTTHFPLIALKPTDEKDSFCLLPLVFERLYKRLLLSLCHDITLIMRLFSKSLAIGLPASRVDAYLRRSDSVRVYWTTLTLPLSKMS